MDKYTLLIDNIQSLNVDSLEKKAIDELACKMGRLTSLDNNQYYRIII